MVASASDAADVVVDAASIYLLFEGKFCSVCTQSRSIANRTAVGLLTAGNSNHNSDWLQMWERGEGDAR